MFSLSSRYRDIFCGYFWNTDLDMISSKEQLICTHNQIHFKLYFRGEIPFDDFLVLNVWIEIVDANIFLPQDGVLQTEKKKNPSLEFSFKTFCLCSEKPKTTHVRAYRLQTLFVLWLWFFVCVQYEFKLIVKFRLLLFDDQKH